jgi:hypothetical protein
MGGVKTVLFANDRRAFFEDEWGEIREATESDSSTCSANS